MVYINIKELLKEKGKTKVLLKFLVDKILK